MKSAAVMVMLALAACVGARDVGHTRALKTFDTRAWCVAGSRLSIRVTSGSCSGVASASCSAFASAYAQWVEDAKEWIANGNCQSETLTAFAQAHASAVASVLVQSLVKVQCAGQGFACGYSVAEGGALASSVAQALASAFVSADPDLENFSAFCVSDIEALAEVLAEASESVRKRACVENYGSEVEFSRELSVAIECAVATAYTRAFAAYCEGQGDTYAMARAESRCEGSASSIQLCAGY